MVPVQDRGDTSAASIPLALSVGRARVRIKPDALLVSGAIGGGLARVSIVLPWQAGRHVPPGVSSVRTTTCGSGADPFRNMPGKLPYRATVSHPVSVGL